MKKFIIEQSRDEFYTSHSGLALIGLFLNRYSELPQQIARRRTKGQDKKSHADIVRSMVGLPCLGKRDFEAVTAMGDDVYFKQSLGIVSVTSTERLRQRLDENAQTLLPIIEDCSVTMLKNGKVPITSLDTGHVPLDADVFPMDNSNTKKEGVSRTYHTYHGYAPIAAYLGLEGWCLGVEATAGEASTAMRGLCRICTGCSTGQGPSPRKNCWCASIQPMTPWRPSLTCASGKWFPLSSSGTRDGRTPASYAAGPLPRARSASHGPARKWPC